MVQGETISSKVVHTSTSDRQEVIDDDETNKLEHTV